MNLLFRLVSHWWLEWGGGWKLNTSPASSHESSHRCFHLLAGELRTFCTFTPDSGYLSRRIILVSHQIIVKVPQLHVHDIDAGFCNICTDCSRCR
jgi:hypothetical protein